jgi:hypothetical protein
MKHIEGVEAHHRNAGHVVVDELIAEHRGLGAAVPQIAAT